MIWQGLLFPAAKMRRIHLHWTAGTYEPNALDRDHYNFLVDNLGRFYAGVPVTANEAPLRDDYAAHTYHANTGAIGIGMCGMGGAQERPFDAGKWPLTGDQVSAACRLAAALAGFYEIPVTPKTTLTHAEVEKNLGIKQRGKWDITRLPFLPTVVGAEAVGDFLRETIRDHIEKENSAEKFGISSPDTFGKVMPKSARVVVETDGGPLNLRNGPGMAARDIGNLPDGTPLTVTATGYGEWLAVETPNGHRGFVSRRFIRLVDGPPALIPTEPATDAAEPAAGAREALADARAALDRLAALL